MNFNQKKYLKYLPSKKFIIIISICFVLIIIIFVIFFMSGKGENYITGNKKNGSALAVGSNSVTDLIEKDSDGDGVPDWEEALWGTDPNKKITFDGIPDATYIENKKKALNIEDSANASTQNLTETDKFAREFFASYAAMKSSGQIDSTAINNFSNALGQKIVNPDLIDRYTDTDIKTGSDDSSEAKQQYYTNMQKLFKSYQSTGMGDELNIVSKSIVANQSGTTENLDQSDKLNTIANAYQDFAQKTIQMTVPPSLANYNLQIANSANNTGISVLNMGKMINDPIVGISGLSQYQKYSDDLVKAVNDLETALLK